MDWCSHQAMANGRKSIQIDSPTLAFLLPIVYLLTLPLLLFAMSEFGDHSYCTCICLLWLIVRNGLDATKK